jgi:ABC-type multidrug transport system ATPase subunit
VKALPVIELNGLSKVYGRTEALRSTDMCIERGEVVAILGLNGAGKTMAIRIASRGAGPLR